MEPATEPSNAAAGADSDWTTYEIPEAALVVTYPSSWARSTDPLMPNLVDPKELVALSTFPARPGGANCAHMPENAIEDMGPTDALVVIQERVGGPEDGTVAPADYPRRPAQFGPETGYPSEAVDCLDRRKAFFDRYIAFSDSGRRFYAYVALGAEAPPEVSAEAWAILDRLEVGTPD